MTILDDCVQELVGVAVKEVVPSIQVVIVATYYFVSRSTLLSQVVDRK